MLCFLPLPSPGVLWAGALSYDDWHPHRYWEKKGGLDGGFRWPAEALALALGPGPRVLGAGCWGPGSQGSLGVPEPLSLPSLPVRV